MNQDKSGEADGMNRSIRYEVSYNGRTSYMNRYFYCVIQVEYWKDCLYYDVERDLVVSCSRIFLRHAPHLYI